ncbi:S26 family signal peptidase [Methylocystis sp.]|uniref:S26 family signal peptidase n=1 Tax=Methylocystis sp. TaxID=1911079 RepID=UPI003D0E2116
MKRGAGRIITLSCGSIAAILLAGVVQFAPILVWNASASAPIGLYRIENRPPEIGVYALVSPDVTLEKFIVGRGYLPENIPLLKRVAALPGDEICRKSAAIFINETYVAEARISDSFGRELPQWNGCFVLQKDEIFLLNDHERSLDGRYFGATKADEVIGVARAVWVRGA